MTSVTRWATLIRCALLLRRFDERCRTAVAQWGPQDPGGFAG
ncbi:hypothetical protein OD998_17695 [Paenarthrobacter nicotinovorans]